MQTINEREIALFALSEIIDENGYNNVVLRRTLNRYGVLKANQKAFITQVVNGTLRNLIHIDYIINAYSTTKTEKMKPLILNVMRISVYQLKFMDKVPVSAVCNEAVELAKKNGYKGLSGFVNGVLRNVARNIENIEYPNYTKEPEKYMEVVYSVPLWIVKYFKSFLGLETAEAICKASLETPSVTACVNTLKTDKDTLIQKLSEEGVGASEGNLENSLKLKNISDIRKLNSFKDGLFHIMDESSMKAVEVLAPKAGDIVFDLCAAPGGKSFYASYLMENQGQIVSSDVHEHKLELMQESADRLGIKNMEITLSDAVQFEKEKGQADCVILDAPCSGLGLIKKKPDIKYTKTFDDIIELAALQKEMLATAAEYVKPGGKLLYSTCTLSKRENEDNVKWFLENFAFDPVDIDGTGKGYFYVLPNIHGTDGFFIALLEKRS